MAYQYDVNCVTEEDRAGHLWKMEERLKKLHNRIAKWFNEGLTQIEYDTNIPAKIKALYPAKLKLSEANFRHFQRVEHYQRLLTLANARVECEAKIKSSPGKFSGEPEDIPKER